MSDTELEPSVEPASEPASPPPAVEPAAAEVHEPSEPASSKPAGYAPVDVKTASPEQIQERIDYLYRQVKPKERENREMRGLLAEQSRIISELSEGQRVVVNHLTEKSYTDSENQLKQQMQDAWKKSDNVGYIEAQTKLNKLYAEQAVSKMQQPQQQQKPNGHMPANAVEVAGRAVETGELTADEYRTTESWQNEKDEMGSMVRPWAFGNHPDHQAALYETRSVLANPRYQDWNYQQKLEEVDRRMGVKKQGVSQPVLRGSLTKVGKQTKIELSPKQREIALRTKYAGKDKSEADHLEAYRKQVERFQTRRTK